MAHAPRSPHVPARDGLRASCVALPAGPWPTVLDFLAERLPALPRQAWAERMAAGDVLCDAGRPVPPHAPYRPQQRLYYWRHLEAEPEVPGEEQVLFQDELLVVADKPHFLPVTPGGRYARQTLLARLQRRLGIDTLVPLHRIDRETAGIVAFCVQPAHRDAYHALVRAQGLRKRYEALAHLPAAPQAAPGWQTRTSRIEEDPERFFLMREVAGAANSETRWRLAEARDSLGRYELEPVTGKRHQLRVHMAALGTPIAGDRFYPDVLETAEQAPGFEAPLQLLARGLAFTDPVTGTERVFESRQRLAWPPAGAGAA